jgi:predicted Zn-dependent protease
MAEMGRSGYGEFLASVKISEDKSKQALIKRIGKRISAAAETFMKNNGMAGDLKYYDWEYTLVDEDDTINAFAMPGGKIVFYTGIMELASGEDELAVVMGHEVAHVIARHGNERMSQMMLVQFGSVALQALLKEKPEETRSIFMRAFGAGSQLGVLLPFSRKHEYEADRIGLHLMADAGYRPSAAVEFWEKMASLHGAPPEFLSTHPAGASRVRKLREELARL